MGMEWDWMEWGKRLTEKIKGKCMTVLTYKVNVSEDFVNFTSKALAAQQHNGLLYAY